MNLSEFIRQNDIKSTDGDEFSHSPEFIRMKEFERACHKICTGPFLEPATYVVKECDVFLTGAVNEKWDKHEKKTKRRFYVNRVFRHPGGNEDVDNIEDAVPAGKTIDEAVEMLEAERQRFEFFKEFDLIDTGRYWLNIDLKRCLVDDGKVVVID